MNPPAVFPLGSNGRQFQFDDDNPHVTKIIHGTWLEVCSWPPVPLTPHPPQIILDQPSKLEAVLFGCRCREEIADKLQPVKVYYGGKGSVQACELINDEAQVADALNRTTCECRSVPLGDKFVALPVNENIVLHYQRLSNVTYDVSVPNTCKLLFKYLPSSLEIDAAVKGLDIDKRTGDITFMIKQE